MSAPPDAPALPWWTLCRPIVEEAGLVPESVPARVITEAIKAYISEVTHLKVRARTDRATGSLILTLPRGNRPNDRQIARLREAIGPAVKNGAFWQSYGYEAVDWWATSLPGEYEEHPSWPVMVPEAHAETARRCCIERLHASFPERFPKEGTRQAASARRWLEAHARQLQRVARVLGRDAVLAALDPGPPFGRAP